MEKRLQGRGQGDAHSRCARSWRRSTRYKPAPLPAALAVTDAGPVAPPVYDPEEDGGRAVEPGLLDAPGREAATIAAPPQGCRHDGPARRPGQLAHPAGQPADARGDRQPRLAVSLRPRAGGQRQRLRPAGREAEPPGAARLARRAVRPRRLVAQEMHRLILTSATYRQSATAAPPAEAGRLKDPENRLLWRGGTRRLDAEQIRDAMLAATGELDPAGGGPPVDGTDAAADDLHPLMRNTRDPLLDVFDLPLGSPAPRRATRHHHAGAVAAPVQQRSYAHPAPRRSPTRLAKEAAHGDAERVAPAYRLAFGRQPTPAERDAAAGVPATSRPRRIDPPGRPASPASFRRRCLTATGQAALLAARRARRRACRCRQHRASRPTTFTVEAFVLLRSLYDDGRVRTIAAQWGGRHDRTAGLVVRRHRQEVAPQAADAGAPAVGRRPDEHGDEPVFSGLHVAAEQALLRRPPR